jgi:hypothetical protein
VMSCESKVGSCKSGGKQASQGRCESREIQKSLACDGLSRANTVKARERWESANKSCKSIVTTVATLAKALKVRRKAGVIMSASSKTASGWRLLHF